MRSKKMTHVVLSVACMIATSGLLLAQQTNGIYDLKTDFSSAVNPNGVWSYEWGGLPITRKVADGLYYEGWCWEAGLDGYILKLFYPESFGYPDLKAGDIVVHSLSVSHGGDATFTGVTWTSPCDGYVRVSGRAWDSWDEGWRDSNWTLSIAGQLVAQHLSVFGVHRTNAAAQFENNLLPGKTLSSVYLHEDDRIEFLTQAISTGHGVGVDLTVVTGPMFAQGIEVGVPQVNTLFESNNVDWVRFFAPSGYVFEVRATQLGTNSDLRLDVYHERTDGSLETICGVNDSPIGEGFKETIKLDLMGPVQVPPGFYLVRVSEVNESLSGKMLLASHIAPTLRVSATSKGLWGGGDYKLAVNVVKGAEDGAQR